MIQESFVTGILYINLTTDNGQNGELPLELNKLHGYPELRTKDSIFAELSEKINFEKVSTQVSKLLDVATDRLDEIDFTSLQMTFPIRTMLFVISLIHLAKITQLSVRNYLKPPSRPGSLCLMFRDYQNL